MQNKSGYSAIELVLVVGALAVLGTLCYRHVSSHCSYYRSVGDGTVSTNISCHGGD